MAPDILSEVDVMWQVQNVMINSLLIKFKLPHLVKQPVYTEFYTGSKVYHFPEQQ